MITVINTMNESSENIYEGMSIMEAANEMLFDVYESCNELMMGTLLTEHAYLYENACEIQYVDEAGEPTKEGGNLITTVVNAIKSAIQKIGSAFENLIDRIAQFFATARNELAKRMINKVTFDKAMETVTERKIPISGWVRGLSAKYEGKTLEEWLRSDTLYHKASDKVVARGDVYGEFAKNFGVFTRDQVVKAGEDDIYGYKYDFEAVSKWIWNTNGVIKDIKAAKKAALDDLNALMKEAKSAKGDDTSKKIESINNAIKSNANISFDKIKVYNSASTAVLRAAKALIKDYKDEEANKKKVERENKFYSTKFGSKVAKWQADAANNAAEAKAQKEADAKAKEEADAKAKAEKEARSKRRSDANDAFSQI